MKLVWHDEFDYIGPPDPNKWSAQAGGHGWGNNELQYYRAENAVVRDGNLVIRVLRENYGGMGYTSARITTSGLFSFTYGRIEARMKLPDDTEGIWPAFWLLPDGLPGDWKYGTWAASGEIDVMEYRSRLPREISGAAHFGGPWPNNVHRSGKYTFPEGASGADWNVYALEWYPDKMIWFVNDIEYFRLEEWYTTAHSDMPAPFDAPFCIIINAAVGGDFDGRRRPNSDFSEAEILIDWIRVYEMQEG